jgi:hypothetical protein
MIMHREISMPQAGLYSLLLVAGLLTPHSNVVAKIISSGNKVSASDMFVMTTHWFKNKYFDGKWL